MHTNLSHKFFKLMPVVGLFLITIISWPQPSFAVDNIHLKSTVHATTQKEKWAKYPTINYGTGTRATLIKKGEHLIKAGDCLACHTNVKDNGKAFAGGFPVKTPFGTIYTPNITPDKQYGIGKWTDQQFIKAMHEGISPKGTYYYPAFPYLYFNRIKKDDLIAMRAYLNAIPPAHVLNKKNSMMFPFNWRFIQLGWRLMFFQFQKQGPFKADPSQSSQWNNGAYLVQGLAHCGMCHTPMWHAFSKKFPLGAPRKGYFLSGGEILNDMLVPNINSYRLKDVPISTITDVFSQCKMIGGGQVAGDMLELDKDSLQYLPNQDLIDIATYIKTIKSKRIPSSPMTVVTSGPGSKVYESYCSTCHAMGAAGAPKFADTTIWEQLVKNPGTPKLYENAIKGLNAMPAKGTCTSCSDQQIKDAVNFMIQAAEHSPHKKTGKPIKKLTLKDGQHIYEQYCAACHTGKYQGAPIVGDKNAWQPLIKKGMAPLIIHSLKGYNNMPARGGCSTCNDAQVIAAVKYMVYKSHDGGNNYQLW